MPQYLSPGVYVEEIPSGIQPIAGVGTSTAGFIGVIPEGTTVPRANPYYDPAKAKGVEVSVEVDPTIDNLLGTAIVNGPDDQGTQDFNEGSKLTKKMVDTFKKHKVENIKIRHTLAGENLNAENLVGKSLVEKFGGIEPSVALSEKNAKEIRDW